MGYVEVNRASFSLNIDPFVDQPVIGHDVSSRRVDHVDQGIQIYNIQTKPKDRDFFCTQ